MSGAEVALAGLVAVLVAVVLVVRWAPRPVPLPVPDAVSERMRRRLVVTLKSGEAFTGVLWVADERAWVLRGAEAVGLGENGADLPVDGEIILMTADIAYAQNP